MVIELRLGPVPCVMVTLIHCQQPSAAQLPYHKDLSNDPSSSYLPGDPRDSVHNHRGKMSKTDVPMVRPMVDTWWRVFVAGDNHSR